jgi:endonuclease/exonuclease/phosphatase (EEP) superfamily protein YafD
VVHGFFFKSDIFIQKKISSVYKMSKVVNSPIAENLKRVTVSICWVYVVEISSFITWRTFLHELPPFLALINCFTPFLFLPLLVFVPLAICTRSKWAMIASMVVLILFIDLYGSLFIPRFESAGGEPSQGLRVMTFNLGYDLGQPEAVIAIIEEQDTDIVAVQEMTADMARLFEQELETFPYMILKPGEETTGVLSRYPILKEEWIEPEGGGRLYLHTVVDWDGEAVSIYAVHPYPPGLDWYKDTFIPIGLFDADQQRQLSEVVERANSEEGIVLIVGDFNMSDQTRAYADIAEVFVDAYREAGWGFGFTFPKGLSVRDLQVPGPFTRVDYIFHSDELVTRWARVGCGGGSDHCYVVAQLGR